MKGNNQNEEAIIRRRKIQSLYNANILKDEKPEPQNCILTPDEPLKEIRTSHLSDLAILMNAALHKSLKRDVIDNFVALKLSSLRQNDSAWDELERLQQGIRELYDVVSDSIIAAKEKVRKNPNTIDFNQPKFKVSIAAILLKVERATLNNWTNNKGGYIRSFQFEGINKFVLESDLKEKYREIYHKDLLLDEKYERYQYQIPLAKIKNISSNLI